MVDMNGENMIKIDLQFFGGRGAASAGKGSTADIAQSNNIKNQFLQEGLNSKFPGIRQKATDGTGNYSFKNAKAVTKSAAEKMDVYNVIDRNGNTLVDGMLKGKHVFYASDSNDSTIAKLKQKQAQRKASANQKGNTDTLTTTTTYDRWYKANQKKMKDFYNIK